MPATKTFLSADHHLGESRMNIMHRPFRSPEEMINILLINHNEIVQSNDIVYHLGDVCYQKTPHYLSNINDFNGRKILIRGNHDRVFTDDELSPYFEQIIAEGDGIEQDIQDIPCYLTHYPSCGRSDRFNLVGHVHSAWKYQLNMMNVGVDVHHFRPIDITTIPFHFEAICKYYDEDVWVAYNPINQQYLGQRGKSGTYYP